MTYKKVGESCYLLKIQYNVKKRKNRPDASKFGDVNGNDKKLAK